MKRVLVIDEFENCEDCPLFRTDRDFNATIHYCAPYPGKDLFMVKEKGISKDCPLKPLPQKKVAPVELISLGTYDAGYNTCVREILGEENE